MTFNSAHFLLFFPAVIAVYFAIPYRYRWIWLLGSSYYFYMSWKPEYVILLLVSTLIDYYAALQIHKTSVLLRKKIFLAISLFSNLALLFGFKYFNFFSSSLQDLLEQWNISYNVPFFEVLLPVGISFYTFQTMAYTIDVYRGKCIPEKHIGIFALYVTFFPQLVAGPIERIENLLPQFYRHHDFDYQRVTDGLKLMLWGFFQKIVIADNLAIVVDKVYQAPRDFTGLTLLLATYFFSFQIYCDFAGYSDIAIGAAQVMGFKLMTNFQRPYFAKSIDEFWQRWHISLSTWFRDYLYIPLGGNRVPQWRWYSNLLIVFIISGLWHGANWTFVIWGLLHGICMLFTVATINVRTQFFIRVGLHKYPLLHKCIQIFVTFHLITFGWIFFRAANLEDAFYVTTHLLVNSLNSISDFVTDISDLGEINLVFCFLMIGLLISIHLFQRHNQLRYYLSKKTLLLRWLIYYVVLFMILMFGQHDMKQFIYFQF